MGDYAEFITPGDKRFDPGLKSVAEWVEPDNIAHCQTEWVIKLLDPIRKKNVGMMYGNHENAIRVYNHDNVQKNICDELGLDNLGYSCFVRFFFRRESSAESHIITGRFTHGSSCAITKGAKMMALQRFMDSFEANFYAYGHVHDYIPNPKSFITASDRPYGQGKIKSKEAIGAMTGSWFKTYTQGIIASYGEQRSYPPTEICCAVFTINPSTGKIEVQRSS